MMDLMCMVHTLLNGSRSHRLLHKNRLFKSKIDIMVHLSRDGFMPDYMLWDEHGEVEHFVDECDGNRGDGDHLDEMLDDIGWEYGMNSKECPLPEEVQKFYRLLAASDDKV